MNLKNQREIENTREKLQRLEERYRLSQREPAENAHVKELSLRSLKRLINQLKEEIARSEANVSVK